MPAYKDEKKGTWYVLFKRYNSRRRIDEVCIKGRSNKLSKKCCENLYERYK